MNICIVTLIRSYEGSEKLYSAQDIGLGKAFAELGHCTNVIRFEKRLNSNSAEKYNRLLTVFHYNVSAIGDNSILIERFLPKVCDVMVCFSDIQISFFQVYKHCKKWGISLIPYIGVIESHSENIIKRFLMNVVGAFNLHLYKELSVCAKTGDVKEKLVGNKISKVVVAPVGLDTDGLHSDVSRNVREKYRSMLIPSYEDGCKSILFVGKLIHEKQPLEALEVFYNCYKKDDSYRLIMIGKGPLKKQIQNFISVNRLDGVVCDLENVSNKDMWQYYVSADCSLNLNRVEIFGMSILEAMYYECPVVAFAAPGPKMIISDKKDGYLFENIEDVNGLIDEAVLKGRLKEARVTIENKYTWKKTAEKMLQLVVLGGTNEME